VPNLSFYTESIVMIRVLVMEQHSLREFILAVQMVGLSNIQWYTQRTEQ
jgi:hypothetical protein